MLRLTSCSLCRTRTCREPGDELIRAMAPGYVHDHTPPGGGRWIPDRTELEIDCARSAAGYAVRFTNGARESWSTWLHTRSGFWIPSILGTAIPRNSFAGLPAC
jgi:hypothetical protein